MGAVSSRLSAVGQMKIATIRLSISNAFLVLGERPVLVDAGSPGEEKKILAALKKHNVAPRDLAAILLTHGHRDHVGSAAAIRAASGTAIHMHSADGEMTARGEMGVLHPIRPRHKLLEPLVNRPFPPLTVDRVLTEGQRLDEFGLTGRVLETPGHSAGSVSFVLDNGDALLGDVLIGGFMGGLIDRRRPRLPYFADDVAQLRQTIETLLPQVSGRLNVGHGGPLEVERARLWWHRRKQI